jgi:hypothetical protein
MNMNKLYTLNGFDIEEIIYSDKVGAIVARLPKGQIVSNRGYRRQVVSSRERAIQKIINYCKSDDVIKAN